MSSAREAALYCAKANARIRRGESTWFYYDEDGMVAVTARLDALGRMRVRSTRVR